MKMNILTSRRDVRSSVALAAIAAAWLAFHPTTGNAAEPNQGFEPAKKVVDYGDLNFANPQAVHILYDRIEAAASQVCSVANQKSPSALSIFKACERQSVAKA